MVRAEEHWNTSDRRLHQVVPATLATLEKETAAHEGDVRRCVEGAKFPQGIDDEHPLGSGRGASPIDRRPAHHRKAELPCLRCHAFRVGRISGHQDQGHLSIRLVAHPPAGPKQRSTLSRAQAAADDDDVAGAIAEARAQGVDFLRVGGRRREVVLHVSGDVEPLRLHSQTLQASGVLLRLHRDQGHGAKHRRDDSGPLVPPAGAWRHAAVQNDGRHTPPVQCEERVRPQVTFDNDHQARPKPAKISVYRPGQVKGKLDDTMPRNGSTRGGETRGREGGDYERTLRKVPLQPAYQRLEKQYLAGRGAVQPDGRVRAGAETETQAGQKVPGFVPAHQAVEQPRKPCERRQQVGEVEKKSDQALQASLERGCLGADMKPSPPGPARRQETDSDA